MTKSLNYNLLSDFIKNNSELFKEIFYYNIIDSTNIEAIRKSSLLKNNAIFITDEQTQGKGRFNRKWFSPPNENLYFSLLLKEKPLPEIFRLVMISSNSILKTLRNYKVKPFIKWPNDIVLNNKKIAGILIEQNFEGIEIDSVIIGIGINLNTDFSVINNISNIATSLFEVKGKKILREKFFISFIRNFEKEYNLNFEDTYKFYISNLYKLNERIKLNKNGVIVNGILKNVDRNGNIVIESEDGILSFNLGEMMF